MRKHKSTLLSLGLKRPIVFVGFTAREYIYYMSKHRKYIFEREHYMEIISPLKHVSIMNEIELMVPSEQANVALAPSPSETGTTIRDCIDPDLSLKT